MRPRPRRPSSRHCRRRNKASSLCGVRGAAFRRPLSFSSLAWCRGDWGNAVLNDARFAALDLPMISRFVVVVVLTVAVMVPLLWGAFAPLGEPRVPQSPSVQRESARPQNEESHRASTGALPPESIPSSAGAGPGIPAASETITAKPEQAPAAAAPVAEAPKAGPETRLSLEKPADFGSGPAGTEVSTAPAPVAGTPEPRSDKPAPIVREEPALPVPAPVAEASKAGQETVPAAAEPADPASRPPGPDIDVARAPVGKAAEPRAGKPLDAAPDQKAAATASPAPTDAREALLPPAASADPTPTSQGPDLHAAPAPGGNTAEPPADKPPESVSTKNAPAAGAPAASLPKVGQEAAPATEAPAEARPPSNGDDVSMAPAPIGGAAASGLAQSSDGVRRTANRGSASDKTSRRREKGWVAIMRDAKWLSAGRPHQQR